MATLSSILQSRNIAISTGGGTTGGGGGGGGGGGSVTVSGSAVTLDTVAALNSATIDASVNYVRVAGYRDVGDPGAGPYKRKATSDQDLPGDQTSNGGTVRWEIIVEGERLSLWRFGARDMTNYLSQPAAGADDDIYRFVIMADKWLYKKNVVLELFVGPGIYYTSKAHNCKRITLNVRGHQHGTMIRCSAYEDVFLLNYEFGNGRDMTQYMNNFTYNAGQSIWKQTGKTGEGNVYRCYATGTSAVTGDNLNGTDPNATYTDGGAQFKYESYIGPNGSNPYDYYLGGDRSCAQTTIRDMQFWSFWDNQSGDPNRNKWPDQHGRPGNGMFNCAIIGRVRCRLDNIFCYQFPGFGVAMVAAGDHDLTGPGNVDGYHIDHLVAYYCGKAGLHTGNAIANAGLTTYLDTAYNGRFGYEEYSFLGNVITGFQSAFDGSVFGGARKQYPSGVLHNGYAWGARLPILGIDNEPNYINEEPGGSNNAWTKHGGDGTLTTGAWGVAYPDWSATQKYEPGGGLGTNNINARNLIQYYYTEGGTFRSQICANDVVIGGLQQDVDLSRGGVMLTNETWNHVQSGSYISVGNLTLRDTDGPPTGGGGSFEIRINRTGGSGQPWAYQFYNSTWNAVGGVRP